MVRTILIFALSFAFLTTITEAARPKYDAKKDYYGILHLHTEASEDDIKSAYRSLARKFHPDVNREDPDTEGKFKEVSEAYEVLSDSDLRRLYDIERNLQRRTSSRTSSTPQGVSTQSAHPVSSWASIFVEEDTQLLKDYMRRLTSQDVFERSDQYKMILERYAEEIVKQRNLIRAFGLWGLYGKLPNESRSSIEMSALIEQLALTLSQYNFFGEDSVEETGIHLGLARSVFSYDIWVRVFGASMRRKMARAEFGQMREAKIEELDLFLASGELSFGFLFREHRNLGPWISVMSQHAESWSSSIQLFRQFVSASPTIGLSDDSALQSTLRKLKEEKSSSSPQGPTSWCRAILRKFKT